MMRPQSPSRKPTPYCWLLVGAGLVTAGGYFGPWAPHRAAGLVITGLDLAEYVKFVPEVVNGQIRLMRELFYLPLFALSLSASLLASRRCLPAWIRFLLALSAVPLGLAMLPPAWKPGDLLLPEYRLQTLAIAVCLLMLPALAFLRYLPNRLVLALIALLCLAGGAWPAGAFLEVRPAIEAVYRNALPLGWGFWTCLVGSLAIAVIGVAEAIRGWGPTTSVRR